MTRDLRIENARVVDGTGAPWFEGGVEVADGTIAAVTRGTGPDREADRVVDAGGSVVCPGFVDAHSHSDLELFSDPTLAPKVRQGVTTEILGQDGFSMAPLAADSDVDAWGRHLSGLAGEFDGEWTWRSLAEYLDAIEAAGVAPNVATLVGHGTVRYAVLGMADRAPDDGELAAMGELVTAALADGAVGLSTGLVYAPQVNAGTEEVRRLGARLAPSGRPFVAHIRNERRRIWEALDEFLDVGADEGIPLHVSHFKLPGEPLHGLADRALAVLETARARGIDVTADQYPYRAGCTTLSNLLPPWVLADGPEATLDRLRDGETRERIRRDIEEWRLDDWENRGPYTGWDNIVVTNLGDDNAAIEGRSVAEIAERRGTDPVGAVCDVLLEEELGASMILHQLQEDDVREILRSECVAIGTDGLFGGRPHPRVHGTYPRILGRYVREENLLTLEAAVRKATSLPARIYGLDRKGLLRPGMDADLVVFDPATVEARATYEEPTRPPAGISHVFVDGVPVVADGTITGETPGRAIRA
ncbi:MAG: amidohydrolase family protein [Haloarculaceae archaeon]